MTDLQTLDALHARLDTHPDDWATRLVLADLFADLGRDDEAACQRWMAANRRRPWRPHPQAFWAWRASTGYALLTASALPERVWVVLASPPVPEGWAQRYGTRRAAEDALLAALRAAGEI